MSVCTSQDGFDQKTEGWMGSKLLSEGAERPCSGSDRLNNNRKPGWANRDSRASQQAAGSSHRPRNTHSSAPCLDFYRLGLTTKLQLLTTFSSLFALKPRPFQTPWHFLADSCKTLLLQQQEGFSLFLPKLTMASLYTLILVPVLLFSLIRSFPWLAFCPWCIINSNGSHV